VVTATALDRERTGDYTLSVKCWDGGSPVSRITEQSFRLTVADINDNAPVFSKQTYHASLVENNFVGLSVLQVCWPTPLSSVTFEHGGTCLCSYRVRGVEHCSTFTDHLTLESYTVFICQQSYLLLSGIPSPTQSFIPGLKPSFSANPSHRSPSFFFFRIHYVDSPDCLLLFLSISVFYFYFFCFYTFSSRFRAVD